MKCVQYTGLLYLVAPISLLLLNPIGFVLMETEKSSAGPKTGLFQKLKTFYIVLKNLILNPIGADQKYFAEKRQQYKREYLKNVFLKFFE